MRAVKCLKYGSPDVLQILDVPDPVPKSNELLVKIEATVVAPPDVAFRKGEPLIARLFTGLARPKPIPGDVIAGVVEAVGDGVREFRPGDRVYGSSCTAFGADAEKIALPEGGAVARMPDGCGFIEAAALCESGLTALPFLRDSGKISKGARVLVNGAAGGIGCTAVQLARHFGAHVTGVCSAGNAELVRSLGADRVIDYGRDDFTRLGEKWDIVFDAVGLNSFSRCKDALTDRGRYLSTVPTPGLLAQMLRTSLFDGKKAVFAATGLRKVEEKRSDLKLLNELIESRAIRAVIDSEYPLDDIAAAHRRVETGHKRGSLVLVVGAGARVPE